MTSKRCIFSTEISSSPYSKCIFRPESCIFIIEKVPSRTTATTIFRLISHLQELVGQAYKTSEPTPAAELAGELAAQRAAPRQQAGRTAASVFFSCPNERADLRWAGQHSEGIFLFSFSGSGEGFSRGASRCILFAGRWLLHQPRFRADPALFPPAGFERGWKNASNSWSRARAS